MRFGLIGTGFWARATHAAALLAEPDAELVGVWGRDPTKRAAVADELDIRAYEDVGALIEDVEALAFAVPPSVQAPIAVRAAQAGRHLLLEKPVAISPADAARMAEAVAGSGVASVVFFTGRFQPDQRRWVEQCQAQGDWEGGSGMWFGDAFAPGSPFDTPWRHEKGGLWDVGPHALAMLFGALGPVAAVTAARGPRDVVHLVLTHDSGATSTAALSLTAPPQAVRTAVTLWGPSGFTEMPAGERDPQQAAQVAVRELMASARTGQAHPCDVRLGQAVVDVLAAAEAQLGQPGQVVPRRP